METILRLWGLTKPGGGSDLAHGPASCSLIARMDEAVLWILPRPLVWLCGHQKAQLGWMAQGGLAHVAGGWLGYVGFPGRGFPTGQPDFLPGGSSRVPRE